MYKYKVIINVGIIGYEDFKTLNIKNTVWWKIIINLLRNSRCFYKNTVQKMDGAAQR